MEVPDYPPNRKPEDEIPGPALSMTAEQAIYIGMLVRGLQSEGATSIDIEERGEGYFQLRVFDKTTHKIVERMVFPRDNQLP